MEDLFSLHKLEYGSKPEVVTAAPGVVNLLGEHTVAEDGYVLQAALNRSVRIAMSKRRDNSLKFYSSNLNERKRTTIPNLKYKREDRWGNYPKGVLSQLGQLGHSFRGVNISIQSDIPPAIGLGSSAALGIATAIALKHLYKLDIPESQIIQSAFLGETKFMEIDTQVCDHIVSAVAKKGHLIFLDLRSLQYDFIPLHMGEYRFLITNSHVPLSSINTELAERKLSCRRCVEELGQKKAGSSLRDFSSKDLENGLGIIPEGLRRICTHVVEENERTLEGKQALLSGDLVTFGKLMNRSHESLRDNFEVSCPELDWMVKRAQDIDGIIGSRLSGPGFGGCTISIIHEGAMPAYRERLDEYERIFGFKAETFFCEPSAGVQVIYP